MIDINPVIEKLYSELGDVVVRRSISLAPAPEKESDLPVIYVHASKNKKVARGGLISHQFAVQIVEIDSKLPALWKKINDILMSSQLGSHPTEYEEGAITDIYQKIIWWVDVYSMPARHKGECG